MMPPLEPPPPPGNFRRFFLHFGPFSDPLADEAAYCQAAIDILNEGPCTILTYMDENRLPNHAILVLYSDEEPSDYMEAMGEIENLEEIALEVLKGQIAKLAKGERDRACEFYLPDNYAPPHARPVHHFGSNRAAGGQDQAQPARPRFPID